MSRRRPRKGESGVPAKVAVRVVCTGRGTHGEVSFGEVVILPSGGTVERLAVGEYFGGVDVEAGIVRKTVPLLCRRCTPARNVPLQRAKLDALCKGLADSGATRLDISALGEIGPISS